jgi:hypothetical protein
VLEREEHRTAVIPGAGTRPVPLAAVHSSKVHTFSGRVRVRVRVKVKVTVPFASPSYITVMCTPSVWCTPSVCLDRVYVTTC